jgi:putative tryptophan/tyrosine transport system substrate-binding protein
VTTWKGILVVSLVLALLDGSRSSAAQAPERSARIGLLAPASRSEDVEGFLAGMRDLGYIEGRNLILEYRAAGGKVERLDELLAELIGLKVDVIVTGGTPAALAAKRARTTIPIVIGAMGDPVESGVVASLARPGGNITGLSLAISEGFAGKYLELLREAVPKASRVAVLGRPSASSPVQTMERAARSLDIRLQLVEVDGPGQLEGAFSTMTAQHAAALIVTPSPFNVTHRDRIVSLAAKHRLPAMYGLPAFVDAGGLMAYGASLGELFRRAATYVDKILKGAKPADLPVEQATKFELVINLNTARALGLVIPRSLLLRADRIIE